MRRIHLLIAAMLGLVLAACAGIGTAPTAEARQALAPTGKLRVALQLGSPHNVVRDSASGEMKGVGYDLGKELARRIGVPFEPVMYPSVGALLDVGKSGAWDVALVGFRPGIDPHAMVIPKGRDGGLAYARQFIEHAKSEGLVKAAIDRVGMRGAAVASRE